MADQPDRPDHNNTSSAQPWQITDRRLLVDRWPYTRVWDEDVCLPDGQVVTHWTHVEIPAFVVMFVLLADGRVPFVRQYRQGPRTFLLELPSGHLEEGEAPARAAQRELLEETGVEAGDWQALGQYVIDSNRGCGWAHVYLARGGRPVAPPDHGDVGEMSLHWLTLAEIEHGYGTAQFTSGPTALAIGLALHALHKDCC